MRSFVSSMSNSTDVCIASNPGETTILPCASPYVLIVTPTSAAPVCFFFFQAEDGIRDGRETGVQTCALPILPHARLLFVGANDAKARILREKADARKIGDRVSVLLLREDIPEILKATDVTVDASYAGLGLTGSLRESLAVGTPVIGTDLEGIPELVRHGQTGLLVRPRDFAGLADALLAVAADPDRARAMARAGRALVERDFSTRAKVERTEALYRRLVAARTGT